MILIEAVLSIWNSSSRSVRIGATTTDSPVWMPIASTFSMPQTMRQQSFLSRITSNSTSFQPITDSSTSTWWMRECWRPSSTIRRSSSSVWATPPPAPPSVYAGRMIAGNPTISSAPAIWSAEFRIIERGIGSPIACIRSLNCSRSSPR